MGKLADLLIRIRADGNEAVRETQKVRAAVSSMGRDAQAAGQAVAVGLGVPLVALGGAAINAFGQIDSLERGLTSITGSAAETSRQFTNLREVAKLPGLGLEEAVKGSINLQAIGYDAEQAQRILLQFGNAVAMVGGGRAELAGVITQLGQMGSKAKVTAEDLKPMINNVPLVGKALKDLYGTVDTEQIQKLGIGPRQLIDSLLVYLEKLPRVTGGIKNEIENTKDSITIALSDIGRAIEGPALAALGALTGAINTLSTAAKDYPTLTMLGVSIGGITVASAGALLVVGSLARSFMDILKFAPQVLAFFGTLGITIAGWGAAMKALPMLFGALGIAVAALGASLYSLYQTYREWRGIVEGAEAAQKSLAGTTDLLASKLNKIDPGGAAAQLQKLFQSGQITMEQYNLGLREVAKGIDSVAKRSTDGAAALQTSVKAAEDYGKAYAALVERLREADEWARIFAKNSTEGNAALGWAAKANEIAFARVYEAMKKVSTEQVVISRQALDSVSIWSEAARVQGELVAGAERLIPAVQATIALSRELPPIIQSEADGYEVLIKSAEQQGQAQFKTNKGMKEISTILTNMNQDIAEAIVNWKGFGDTAVSVARSIGKAILSQVVGSLMETSRIIPRVMSGLSSVFNAVGLGGIMGTAGATAGRTAATVAGSAVPAASPFIAQTLAGSIPGIAGGGASAAGAAAAAASSSLMGVVGAVGSVVSAVSSIIGNFQFAAMNKSLDLIEKEVRYTQIHMLHLLEKANTFWPVLGHIHERLMTMVGHGVGVYNAPGDGGLRLATAGGGDSTTVQINLAGANLLTSRAMDDFIDEFISRIRQRGIKI